MGKFTKNQFNIEGGLPKKSGAWTFFRFDGEEGAAGEKAKFKRGCFWVGG